MCSISGHTHGIKTLEFESDSTQWLQLLDFRWIVYRLPGFWGRGSNKSIFHCARSTPLTPAWFKGQLYLPFHLWIVHQSALTPSIVASRPTPHSVPFYLLLCLVAQSCPTLCDPMDCSPPGFFVHGDSPGKNTGVGCHLLLQGSSQLRDGTQVSRFAGLFLTVSATKEALLVSLKSLHLELPTPAASIRLLLPTGPLAISG